MQKGKTMGMDFTQGPIMPMLLKFFLPFLLANALNNLYNTVDAVIIGQFLGSYGIVAVSMGGKMLALYTLVGTALAAAGQVLISQHIGAGRKDELNSTIGTLFSELLAFSVLFAIINLCFGSSIMALINTPDDSLIPALDYLRITSIGLPLMFGYNAVSSVLRAMGDSKSPLLFIAIATVLNIVLDIVFIVFFNLGVVGTALATVIGQGVSLVFSLTLLYRKRAEFGFDFKLSSFKVVWSKLALLLKLGLPLSMRGVFIIATQMYLLSFINSFGMAASAAYNVSDKIYHVANIFAISVREAGGTMVAQNIGARRYDRVKTIVGSVAKVSFSAAAIMAAISLAFPKTVFSAFSSDPQVLAQAASYMMVCCVIYFLSAAIAPYEGVVSGTGNAKLGFLGGMLDGVFFRIGFGMLFGLVLDMGALGFFLGDALARTGIVLVGAIYYHSGKWMKYRIISD
ncbi:MAG: MATE family efflux transporter [Oscillospiraceae bacterium]|nr:MATE family efflux transporter [Oscillospiraceae bacterium]